MEEIVTERVSMPVCRDARYVGSMRDGLFHGSGCLMFSDGGIYRGVWEDGKHVSGTYIFPDGLPYSVENWGYLTEKDRRFWTETINGLRSGDVPQETNIQPTPKLPLGHYDTGDGIFDPFANIIYNYKGEVLRRPGKAEKQWIRSNCRRGLEEDVEGEVERCLMDLLDQVELQEVREVVDDIVSRVSDVLVPAQKVVEDVVTETVFDIESPEHIVADVLQSVIRRSVAESGKGEGLDESSKEEAKIGGRKKKGKVDILTNENKNEESKGHAVTTGEEADKGNDSVISEELTETSLSDQEPTACEDNLASDKEQ